MIINTKQINRMLLILAAIIVIGAILWSFSLNEAQRLVVLIGTIVTLVYLFGLSLFFKKKASRVNRH